MLGLRALSLLLLALLAPAVARAQGEPANVRVGLYVTSISDIDFANGSFVIGAFAWFVHPPGEYDPTKQIAINARDSSAELIQRSTLPDGSIYDWVKVKATVDQDFHYDRFPFDQQPLHLVLEAEDPVNVIRLVPDIQDSRISELVSLTGWDVKGWQLTEQPVSYDTDFGWPGQELRTYSRLTLSIQIARQRSGLMVEKFLGFTMALLMSLLIYLIPANQFSVRVGLAGGAIFAAVGNRYSLDVLLGSDSQVGLVDELTVLVFASIYTALVVSVLTYRVSATRGEAVAHRIDRMIGIGACVLYLGLAGVAILRARV